MEPLASRANRSEEFATRKVAARLSLLIVDDFDGIRVSFARRFEKRYGVHAAKNGAEALAILRREPGIAVVVTDVHMPVMTGLELIRHARPEFPDVGFIVVSGQSETEDVIQALQAGARNFLRKPYSAEESSGRSPRNWSTIARSRKAATGGIARAAGRISSLHWTASRCGCRPI